MRHSFIIFTLGLGLTQLTACRSNAKLDASASITVEEVSSNGIPGILIALNLRNNSNRTWSGNHITFECRDGAGKIVSNSTELGTLDKPTREQQTGKRGVGIEFTPEGNLLHEGEVLGSTRIESPILPTCFPTRVTVANNRGRAEFELNPKDLKWRRIY